MKIGKQNKCGGIREVGAPNACPGAEPTYTTAQWPHRMDDIIQAFCP